MENYEKHGKVIEEAKSNELEKNALLLRTEIFNSSIKFIGEGFCTIDLLGFLNKDEVILMPCGHIFHARCIKGYFDIPGKEKKCPNCNFTLEGYAIS